MGRQTYNLQANLVEGTGGKEEQNESHASVGSKAIIEKSWLNLKGCTDGDKEVLMTACMDQF